MLTRLPHQVIVQTLTRVPVGGGAYEDTWLPIVDEEHEDYNQEDVDDATKWANVQPVNTEESYQQDKAQAVYMLRVVMRKQDITNKNRLIFRERILVIETAPDPTERGRMMELVCREEVDN